MRKFLSIALLLILSSVSLAETVTTTDGMTYRKAKDGQLYPSQYVTADGSVTTTPVQQAAPAMPKSGCEGGKCYPAPSITPVPQYRFIYPQGGCPNGRCPAK